MNMTLRPTCSFVVKTWLSLLYVQAQGQCLRCSSCDAMLGVLFLTYSNRKSSAKSEITLSTSRLHLVSEVQYI